MLIYLFLLDGSIGMPLLSGCKRDLSALDPEVALAIQSAAMIPEVVAFARRSGLDSVALVVGLVARSESLNSRSAARLAKAIFHDIAHEGLDHIAQMLGLKGGSNLTSGN